MLWFSDKLINLKTSSLLIFFSLEYNSIFSISFNRFFLSLAHLLTKMLRHSFDNKIFLLFVMFVEQF